jgi:hypothetical protein
MRNALMILLLLNCLAYLYQRWVLEPENKLAADYLEQSIPKLSLAEPYAVTVADIPVPELSENDQLGYRCLRLGPFPREAEATAALRMYQQSGAKIRQTAEEGQVWTGHWVQVVGQSGRGAAKKARDNLIAAGIKDAYLLPGDDGFGISLGVYTKRTSANKVMEKAIQLGYDTRLEDRYQPGSNYWLHVRIPKGGAMQLGEFRTDSGQILRKETVACSAADI